MEYSGVININKEKDYTSHDVVNIVRKTLTKTFGKIKVGHTGTLDPNACGVLPICIGKATKISSYLMSGTKKYRAEVILGITTDSEDITGNVLSEQDAVFNEQQINEAVYSFKGEYYQTPPMYSAIKVNGKKLYELARKGENISRQPRLVNIFDINIIEFISSNRFVIEVTCSKGTYIRTLCVNIGEKLGCGACMGQLTRTASGNFSIEQSITLSEFKAISETGNISSVVISIKEAMKEFYGIIVSEKFSKPLYNGNTLKAEFILGQHNFLAGQLVLVSDYKNELVGLYSVNFESDKPVLKPNVIFYGVHS